MRMRSPIAVRMPDTSPPPPTATITASASGASSSISSPTVPAPAITSGSSNGWTSVRPVSAWSVARRVEGVGRVGRLEVDGRAVASRRVDLLLGRALPHHDEGVGAFRGGGERDGLGVVAGADRDHAACFLLGGQAAELVQRAAGLERAGALEELALQAGAERCGSRRAACGAGAPRSWPARARRRRGSGGSAQPRWRTASKSRIAAAVDAFRLSTLRGCIGIEHLEVGGGAPALVQPGVLRADEQRRSGRSRSAAVCAVGAPTTAATFCSGRARTSSRRRVHNGQREHRAGRRTDRVRVPRIGRRVGHDERVGPGRVGRPRERPEVARLLDPDGDEHERRVRRDGRHRRLDDRKHTLRLGAVAHLGQHARGHLRPHRAASRAATPARGRSPYGQAQPPTPAPPPAAPRRQTTQPAAAPAPPATEARP